MAENSTAWSTFSPSHITILQDYQIAVITKVYIAFLIPSVIGSFSVLLVSLLRWRNLQEQRQLLVQLALADLLASVLLLWVTTTNLNLTKVTEYNTKLCLYGLPLALVFYILSFMLAIIYAHKSKNVFRGWRSRPADCEDVQSEGAEEKSYYVLLWLVLGGMYFIYMMITQHRATDSVKKETDCCRSCLLFSHMLKDGCPDNNFWHQEPIYVVLFFMAVEVILLCTVIYHQVSKWYQGQQQHQQGLFPVEGDGQSRKRFKHVKHTARKMVLVIIVCWFPALLLFVLTFSNVEQNTLFALYIIQAATVSLQGFLNSMVYAWKRPNFTEAVLGERTPLIAYHQAAFFEESLKTSV